MTTTTVDQPDFLQPGFDPEKCTVPRLRNVLLEWEVDFKSSARKGELVELYREHIAPAVELMKQRSKGGATKIPSTLGHSSLRKSMRFAGRSESKSQIQGGGEHVSQAHIFTDHNPFQVSPQDGPVSRRKTFAKPDDVTMVNSQQKRHAKHETKENNTSESEFEPNIPLPSSKRWNAWHILTFSLFLLVLIGLYLWRAVNIAAGFCGVEEGGEVDIVSGFSVKCKGCPPHASCFRDMRAECDPGYLRVDDIRSLLGLSGPRCVPDQAMGRRVALVAEEAIQILREAQGEAKCGLVQGASVAKDSIEAVLLSRKASTVSDQQISALWKEAFPYVCERPEVIAREQGGQVFLESNSPAYISLKCTLKRMIHACIVPAGGTILLFIIGAGIWRCSAQRRLENSQVRTLVRDVYTRLAQKKHNRPGTTVSVAQLRDAVLADMDIKQRKRLWQAVQKIVECNSNVRARQVELRGEITRVWEWVGD